MPLAETLVDDFTTDKLSTLWPGSYGNRTVEEGRAHLYADTGYNALMAPGYTMAGSSFSAELTPPDPTGATAECWVEMKVVHPTIAGTQLSINIDATTGNMRLSDQVGYFDGTEVAVVWSATTHRFTRFRELGGTLFFESSADGIEWTILRSKATPAWVTSLTDVALVIQSHRDTGTGTNAYVDRVNVSARVPGVREGLADFADDEDLTITTSPNTAATDYIVAVQTWDWDPDNEMVAPTASDGRGWELLADTTIASSAFPHMKVWGRYAEAAGALAVTFTAGELTDDNHGAVIVLEGCRTASPVEASVTYGFTEDDVFFDAASVDNPDPEARLLSIWGGAYDPPQLTRPAGTDALTESTGFYAEVITATEILSAAGPTGTRTAFSDVADVSFAAVQLVVRGPGVVTFPDAPLDVRVELGLGEDPMADPATWAWTDVSDYVRVEGGISITRGKPDESGVADVATCSITFDNADGRFVPTNPSGAWFGSIRRNCPVRVRVDPGSGTDTRFVGLVPEWPPRWDPSGNSRWVTVAAAGPLRRVVQGNNLAEPALVRAIKAMDPMAYWPCDDAVGSDLLVEATGSGQSGTVTGSVSMAGGESFPAGLEGSNPLPILGSTGRLRFVPPTGGDAWTMKLVAYFPAAPSATTTVASWTTAGDPASWRLDLEVGSPDTLRVYGFFNNGVSAQLPLNFVGDDTGAELYGRWVIITIWAQQSGTDINVGFGLEADGHADSTSFLTGQVAEVAGPTSIALQRGTVTNPSWGHVAVWDSVLNFSANTLRTVLNGGQGETAAERMSRVAAEAGIAFVSQGTAADTARMGAQPSAAFLDILREAEQADGGVLYEGRSGRLHYLTRSARYNRTTSLALDYDEGQVAQPFEPVDDDRGVRNDVTVSRSGGSSSRAVDRDHIAEYGRYDEAVTLNVEQDNDLADQAGWRLHLGTSAEGLRFPLVAVNLHRSPELIAQAVALDVGDVVTVTNPPAGLPPGPFELTAEGYSERIEPYSWRLELNCAPAAPWVVGVLDDPVIGRLDGDQSYLDEDLTTSETAWRVRTDNASPLWTTDDDEFPFDVELDGEVCTVTDIAPNVWDRFNSNVASGWGSVSIEGSATGWGSTGAGGTLGSTDYYVAAGTAWHAIPATSAYRFSYLGKNVYDVSTVDLQVVAGFSVMPTGGDVEIGNLMARIQDVNNYYFFRVAVDTAGKLTVSIRKLVAAAETVLVSAKARGRSHTITKTWAIRAQVFGSRLRMKVWDAAAEEEPTRWDAAVTDSTFTSGGVGVRTGVAAGNTNAKPVAVSYENFQVLNPQTWTVTRATNGIVKAHDAGTQPRLANPLTLAL